MIFEVVSHCFAKKLPHYAKALHYQLESIANCRMTGVDVRAVICLDPDDKRTMEVLAQYVRDRRGEGLLRVVSLRMREFSRRCIGRNQAALATKADVVWFSDVDQMYSVDAFYDLAETDWQGAAMVYPGQIMISKDHVTGDSFLRGDAPGVPGDFVVKKYNRAIGGVQIVKGDFARQFGYLNGTEWMKFVPVENNDVLPSFRDDIAYRRFCHEHGGIRKIELRGVYRIRHSTTSYQTKK